MKKSIAESIRSALTLLEAPAHMADALQDLHSESGGKPTIELANEIAADYPGVNGERLMQEYPAWAEAQANKSSIAPAQDPKKAAMAQKYKANQDREARRQEIEAERERRKQELEDRKKKHREDHADLYTAASEELEKFKHLPGWKVEEAPTDSYGSFSGSDTFAIDNGDGIKIVLWSSVSEAGRDPEKWPAKWEIHGDVKFTVGDKAYTYTRRGIDIDSFSVRSDKPEDPAAVVQQQVDRVQASRAKMEGEVEVPGTGGLRISKDEISTIADTIRKDGKYTLAPAGMGIGYELSAKPRQWSRPAPDAMKNFFGLDQLYIFQLDYD